MKEDKFTARDMEEVRLKINEKLDNLEQKIATSGLDKVERVKITIEQ